MRHLLLPVVIGFGALMLLPESSLPARAQVGNFGYGSSIAGGSGGLPTGPSNLGGIYGLSSAAGSGGAPTGLINPSTLGYGISTSGGPGATATGPTNPILPQFPATASPVAPTPSTPAIGLPALGNTPGVVAVTPALSPQRCRQHACAQSAGSCRRRARHCACCIDRYSPIGWHRRIGWRGPIGEYSLIRHWGERTLGPDFRSFVIHCDTL